jgi:hypothetical protein
MQHPVAKMSTALAGASLIATTQILTTNLDLPLTGAVWIFAICLPLLLLSSIQPGIGQIDDNLDQFSASELKAFKRFMVVALADILGFTLLFFHFGLIAGCLFCGSCLFALAGFTNWKTVKGLGYILLLTPLTRIQKWAKNKARTK